MKTLTNIINEGLIKQTKQEFIIIKPGFLDYSTRILDELLVKGFVVRNRACQLLTYKTAKKIYRMHKDEPFYEDLCRYMSSGVSMGVTLLNTKGLDFNVIKEEIRKKYGVDEMRNAIHSSDNVRNMKRESKLYFMNSERNTI